jgi:hypothetical protein
VPIKNVFCLFNRPTGHTSASLRSAGLGQMLFCSTAAGTVSLRLYIDMIIRLWNSTTTFVHLIVGMSAAAASLEIPLIKFHHREMNKDL